MTDCPGGFCLRHNLGAAVWIDALDRHNEDVGVSRDGVHSTDKKFTIVRLGGLQLARQLRQSKYVLEHILRPSQLHSGGGAWIRHSWPLTAISLGVVASHPTHLFWTGRFCPTFESRRRSQQCNALNHIATLLTKRMQQMIDGGLRSV
jgi:hypothetical protein